MSVTRLGDDHSTKIMHSHKRIRWPFIQNVFETDLLGTQQSVRHSPCPQHAYQLKSSGCLTVLFPYSACNAFMRTFLPLGSHLVFPQGGLIW